MSQSTVKTKSQKHEVGEISSVTRCFGGASTSNRRESKKAKPGNRHAPRPMALVNPLAVGQRASIANPNKKGGKESYPKLEQELLQSETKEVL